MRIYKVYRLFCEITERSYIGQTKQRFSKRFSQHLEKRNQKFLIGRALKKHGCDAFKKEILAITYAQDAADALEQYYIQTLKTQTPHGYNLTRGGDGGGFQKHTQETIEYLRKIATGKKASPETRAKMSASHRGVPKHWSSMKGRKHRSESIKKMSESKRGEKNYMYGKRHSEETKRRIADSVRRTKRARASVVKSKGIIIRISLCH